MLKKSLQIILVLCLGGSVLKAQCVGSAGPDQTICVGTTATLAATLPTGYTAGTWTKVVTTPPAPAAPAGVITTTTSATSTVTGITAAGTLTLVWTVTGTAATCTDTVNIVIQAIPTANAGTNSTICANGTATLGASSIPTGSIGTWTKLGGINSATTVITTPTSRTSTVTGFPIATNGTGAKDTLKWTVSNAACPTLALTKLLVITVNAAPTTPNAGLDKAACHGDTITLYGTTPTVGTPSWILPGGSILSFVGSGNNDTVKVRATVGGKTLVAYRIANGSTNGNNAAATVLNGCVKTDTVVVTYNPSTPNAGVDIGICQNNLTSVTLAATPVAAGETGAWSFVTKKGSEVITTPTSPTSTVTAVTSDTLTLRWTVTGGGCTNTDDMLVLVSKAPSTANAGANKNRTGCVGDTLLLIGNNATIGKQLWSLGTVTTTSNISFISTGGTTATGTGTANDSIKVRLRTAGTYTIYYTIAVGAANTASPCTSRDSMKIVVSALPTANAGANQSSCDGSTTSFTVRGNKPPVGGTGQWSIVAPGTGTVTTSAAPADTVATVTGLAKGVVTTLVWKITNAAGCIATSNMTITMGPFTTANAGLDRAGCMNDTILLIGSNPTTGTPTWARNTGTANSNIGFVALVLNAQANTNNDSIKVRLRTAGTYSLVYTITLGTCTSSDTMTIVSNALPTANAGASQVSCNGSTTTFTVTGNKPAGTTGKWSIVAPGKGTVTMSAAPADTVATVTGLAPGITILAWQVTNTTTGCTAKDTMTITLGPTLVANAGLDKTGCQNDTLKLFGTIATIGTPVWSYGTTTTATNISFVPNGNNDTVKVALRTAGTYRLVYSITLGACPVSRDTMTYTINAAPTGANAGVDQVSCAGATSFTVKGNKPAAGFTGAWSIVAPGTGTVTPSAAPADTVGTVTGLAKGITTLAWKVTNTTTTCTATDNMIITLGPTLVANAGPDKTGCVGDTLPVYGNVATLGTPVWSYGTTTPTSTATNLSFVPNGNNDTVNVRLRTAGTYKLVYKITLGTCPASIDTMVFTVNAAPTVAAAGNGVTTACGATVTLTGNTPVTGTPSWTTSNATLASFVGSSAASVVNVKLAAAGTANMTYKISNGTTKACISSNTLVITASTCTGIFDNGDKVSNISLHPNPTSSMFYLSFKDTNAGSAEMTISTLDGRIVHAEQLGYVKEISKEINISDLAKGIYFVKVKMGGATEFKKLVIQ